MQRIEKRGEESNEGQKEKIWECEKQEEEQTDIVGIRDYGPYSSSTFHFFAFVFLRKVIRGYFIKLRHEPSTVLPYNINGWWFVSQL